MALNLWSRYATTLVYRGGRVTIPRGKLEGIRMPSALAQHLNCNTARYRCCLSQASHGSDQVGLSNQVVPQFDDA